MDKLPSLGVFWRPDSPEDTFAGQLDGHVGKIQLGLTGQIEVEGRPTGIITGTYFEDLPRVPIIHGVIRGALVTLLDCSKIHLGFSAPGFMESRYRPHYVIFGAHLGSDPVSGPVGISVRYSHLLRWLGTRGLIGSFDQIDGTMVNARWNYGFPPSFDWSLNGYAFSLRGGMDQNSDWGVLNAQEYGYFNVKSESPKSVAEWHREIITPLHEMLRFAFFNPVDRGTVKLLLPEDVDADDSDGPDFFRAELVINEVPESFETTRKDRHPEMLFHAEQLTSGVFEHFLDVESPTRTLRQRFGLYERTRMGVDDFFLSYVRLIESFHRMLNPVSQNKISEHTERLMSITMKLDVDDASFVLGRLEFGYEPSLNGRINQLLKPWRTKPRLKAVVRGGATLSKEIEDIARHRNFLAHELPDDQRVLKGERLRRACLFLMIVSRLIVLEDAGFTSDEAWDAVNGTDLMTRLKSAFS